MDTGSLIIGLIILAITLLPFALLRINRIKRENKLLKELEQLAQSQHGQIDEHEICGNFIIGIDQLHKKVFFQMKNQSDFVQQFVDLTTCKASKVINTSKTSVNPNGAHTYIEKIEILFLPLSQHEKEIQFELYNIKFTPQLSGELQAAENWSKKINQLIG